MDISIIVPLFNEDESLPHLAEWIDRVMNEHHFDYEVIMVDDGSRDRSWQVIEELHANNPRYKGVKFRRNSGWKKKRYDSKLAKNIPSKFFNWTTRKMSGIQLHDFNCGLKAYRHDVVKSIEVYGEMHRYIPVIAKWAGFTHIGEKVVQHRKREFGVTKFGLNRFVNGYLDLMSIMFMSKFGKQPMHFFGLMGSLAFLLGFVAFVIVCVMRLCGRIALTNSVWFYVSMLFILMGTMLFLAGFLGELICRNSTTRNQYLIEKEVLA